MKPNFSVKKISRTYGIILLQGTVNAAKNLKCFQKVFFKVCMNQEYVCKAHLRSFQIKHLRIVAHQHKILSQVSNAPVFVITNPLLHEYNPGCGKKDEQKRTEYNQHKEKLHFYMPTLWNLSN